MRTSMIRTGLGFGALGVTIRGTTKYHLSPMEQKAFAGAISQGWSRYNYIMWVIENIF